MLKPQYVCIAPLQGASIGSKRAAAAEADLRTPAKCRRSSAAAGASASRLRSSSRALVVASRAHTPVSAH